MNLNNNICLKRLYPAFAFICIWGYSFSQNIAINTTGNPAVASAMLDITSTTSGMLIPRMTAAQKTAIASPANGLLIYQTDAPMGFWYYDASIPAWVQIQSSSSSAGWLTTGNTVTGITASSNNKTRQNGSEPPMMRIG